MNEAKKRIHLAVDRLLMEQGRYEPLELLLRLGRLPYDRYEAWRNGELERLEEALAGSHERIMEQLETAAELASRLGLHPEESGYRGWGGHGAVALKLSNWPERERLLCTHYRRAPDPHPQLDLFLDAGVTGTLNELCDALAARDRPRAEQLLEQLLQQQPEHRLRGAAELLCDALAHLDGDHQPESKVWLAFLAERLEPVAIELLGHRSRDYVAPFWRKLGETLEALAPDEAHGLPHPSLAYAKCLDWRLVADTIRRTRDAAEQPELLARLAEARRHLGERSQAVAHWCQLCWRHPQQAEAIFVNPLFPDQRIHNAWERFQELEIEPESAWFPAWILLREPGLARAMPLDTAPDRSGPERGFTLIQRLLVEEGDGAVSVRIELRRGLKEEHPGLLELYLASIPQRGPP